VHVGSPYGQPVLLCAAALDLQWSMQGGHQLPRVGVQLSTPAGSSLSAVTTPSEALWGKACSAFARRCTREVLGPERGLRGAAAMRGGNSSHLPTLGSQHGPGPGPLQALQTTGISLLVPRQLSPSAGLDLSYGEQRGAGSLGHC